MALAVGSRLGSHEIIGLLGAGGMGEVYRAQDTKLNRQVDAMPDGEHVVGLTVTGVSDSHISSSQIMVVLNWFDELRARVPGK